MLRPRTQGALRQSLFTSVFSPVFLSPFGRISGGGADAYAVVNRDGATVVNRDGATVVADPTERTS